MPKDFSRPNPTPNVKAWSHPQFSSIFAASPRMAYEFRWDTTGDPVPENLLTEEEKSLTPSEDVVEKKKPGRKPKEA